MSKLTEILELLEAKTIKAVTYDPNPPSPATLIKDAEQAINAYIAEVIGETPHQDDCPAKDPNKFTCICDMWRQNYHQLEAEQRKRAGL